MEDAVDVPPLKDYIPARGLAALILATGAYTAAAATAATLRTGVYVAEFFIESPKYVTLFFIRK
ncbi:hypothetical protein JMN32_17175 [Fulvivirga sp. 29W222]|uniref:Uncharacterized protein n=1 Tax=Fulvivirga marina TaxID=2494733 RepID=A0A937KFC4_9BACT|nr:hypothetical protein [Fulvivirga marina]MBL6448053.1 hypothetical protein [Fulvivirga marina]